MKITKDCIGTPQGPVDYNDYLFMTEFFKTLEERGSFYLHRRVGVILVDDPEDIGYTMGTSTGAVIVAVNYRHDYYEGLTQKEKLVYMTGIFIHEILHQILTPFSFFNRATMMHKKEAMVFHQIANIMEDPYIEATAKYIVGTEDLECLRYSIRENYNHTPKLGYEAMDSFREWILGMIQFGDVGPLKGHFQHEETKKVFLETAPIVYDCTKEVFPSKRLKLIEEVFELTRPLWMVKEDESALEKLEKELRKYGKTSSHSTERDDSCVPTRRMTEEEDEKEASSKEERKTRIRKMIEEEEEKEHSESAKGRSEESESDTSEEKRESGSDGESDGSESGESGSDGESDGSESGESSSDGESDGSESGKSGSDGESDGSESGKSGSDGESDGSESGKSGSDGESDGSESGESGSEGESEDSESETPDDDIIGESGQQVDAKVDGKFKPHGKSHHKSEMKKVEIEDRSSEYAPGMERPAEEGTVEEKHYEIPQEVLKAFEKSIDGISYTVGKKEEEARKEAEMRSISKRKVESTMPKIESPLYKKRIDCINYFPETGSYEGYDRIREAMGEIIAVSTKKWKKLMFPPEEAKRYSKSGKFNWKRYNSAKVTPRIYTKKKTPNDKNDWCLMVQVDESGSMYGEKACCARDTAIVIAEVCAKLDIPVYIFGFSTTTMGPGEKVAHFHYVRWDNTFEERVALQNIRGRENNLDSFSVRYASQILKKRTEAHRVHLILSDGAPSAYGFSDGMAVLDTANAIESARQISDVIGVGIGTGCNPTTFDKLYGGRSGWIRVLKPADVAGIVMYALQETIKSW